MTDIDIDRQDALYVQAGAGGDDDAADVILSIRRDRTLEDYEVWEIVGEMLEELEVEGGKTVVNRLALAELADFAEYMEREMWEEHFSQETREAIEQAHEALDAEED